MSFQIIGPKSPSIRLNRLVYDLRGSKILWWKTTETTWSRSIFSLGPKICALLPIEMIVIKISNAFKKQIQS